MDKPKLAWYYQPWIVVLSLFFVLGPFGLPLVFKHPTFSRTTKIFLTAATLAYTAYLIWATIKIVLSLSTLLIPTQP